MQFILMRHGKPEEFSISDEMRALSGSGRSDVTKVAKHFQKQKLSIKRIFHSPLLRTTQTAEIVAEEFGLPHEVADWLSPDGNDNGVLEALKSLENEGLLLIVGHQPNLLTLTSLILGGDPNAREGISLPTGGAVLIESHNLSPKSGKLKWMISPSELESKQSRQ